MQFRGIPEEKLHQIRHLVPRAVAEIRKVQQPGTRLPTVCRAMTDEEIREGRQVRGPGHEGGAGHGLYDGQTVAVNTSMSPLNILLNIIHELLHSALPDIHEVEIDRLTDEIMDKLNAPQLEALLTRTPLALEDMTPVERSSLRLAIHRGQEGPAQRIQRQVMRRETQQHKERRGAFKRAVASSAPGVSRLKRQLKTRELERKRPMTQGWQVSRAARKLRAHQPQVPAAVAAGIELDRNELLLDAIVSGVIATPPSPHVRPDLYQRRISGAPRKRGVTDTGYVGLRSKGGFAVYPGAVRKEKEKEKKPPLPPTLASILGKKIAESTSLNLSCFSGDAAFYSLDLPQYDHVKKYEEWRHQCPNYNKPWHAAFCKRCDEDAWRTQIGGANFARRKGWAFENPLQGYPSWETINDSLEPTDPSHTFTKVGGCVGLHQVPPLH